MTFKMVTESEKAAGRIAGTALAHAELIAGEQTARWKDRLPDGQEVVDAAQIQHFHGEDLLRLRELLRRKEAGHLEVLKKIRETRERRDAVAPGLRKMLYAIRDLFKGIYGEEGPRALFLGKPVVPMDATPLRRVGRLVAAKLEDPELELPEATLKKGTRLTMSELAGEIKEPLEAMEQAMKELEDLLPMAARSLEEKREAHAAVDEKNAKLARFLEGLYELEGHDVLAAKVRPSSHRRGDAGDPEKPGAEASGGPALRADRTPAPQAGIASEGEPAGENDHPAIRVALLEAARRGSSPAESDVGSIENLLELTTRDLPGTIDQRITT